MSLDTRRIFKEKKINNKYYTDTTKSKISLRVCLVPRETVEKKIFHGKSGRESMGSTVDSLSRVHEVRMPRGPHMLKCYEPRFWSLQVFVFAACERKTETHVFREYVKRLFKFFFFLQLTKHQKRSFQQKFFFRSTFTGNQTPPYLKWKCN